MIRPRSVRSKTCRVFCIRSLAQRSFVVDAGRIDEQHRPDGQDFHRLFYRVGGRAGDGGDNRDLLFGQRVQERRLARIAAAEQADVEAEGFGGRLHF